VLQVLWNQVSLTDGRNKFAMPLSRKEVR